MKRDMDLVRQLLLYFEDRTDEEMLQQDEVRIDGYDSKIVGYNIDIMYEAGLLCCEPVLSQHGRLVKAIPFRLTWDGHEFLDASRDTGIWNKAKQTVLKKSGGITFELLVAVLKQMAMQAMGLGG
jgi:hypothetical protein